MTRLYLADIYLSTYITEVFLITASRSLKMDKDKDDPWGLLTKTWVGPILALIAVATSFLVFIEGRGLLWTTIIITVALWGHWWTTYWQPTHVPLIAGAPAAKKYPLRTRILWALPAALATVVFVILAVFDISKLNIWRTDYSETNLPHKRYGSANAFFGDVAPRFTPEERAGYEDAEWIRWMENAASSAKALDPKQNVGLLFIETDMFDRKYHTFTLEVHDLGKQVRPFNTAVAFLVQDRPKDPWRRRILRQVDCMIASDANTRLFRVTVDNPDEKEYLWLFLRVTSSQTVDLNSLNLQLKVR